MLNIESRRARFLVWLAIAIIVSDFLWTFLDWPSVPEIFRTLADSELGNMVGRNQTFIGALIGLGGLALAYLLNGWRDRAEQRHAIERAERRLGGVLAREAQGIAAACAAAAEALAGRSAGLDQIARSLKSRLAPEDHVLLSSRAAELARLGAGAAAAAKEVRRTCRHLLEALDRGTGGEASDQRLIGARAIETALAAQESARIFEAVAGKGPALADRLRLLPAAGIIETERLLEGGAEGQAARLLPAA
jgi:hypothetical protein